MNTNTRIYMHASYLYNVLCLFFCCFAFGFYVFYGPYRYYTLVAVLFNRITFWIFQVGNANIQMRIIFFFSSCHISVYVCVYSIPITKSNHFSLHLFSFVRNTTIDTIILVFNGEYGIFSLLVAVFIYSFIIFHIMAVTSCYDH